MLAVTQRFAGFDLIGDVFGHPDDTRDLIVGVSRQRLFTDVEAPPHAVAMTKTQLALQQVRVAAVALLLAHQVVMLGIFGVQQQFPEVSAHLLQFGGVVAQGVAQMVVAENHPLADDVLHVQVVRHGAHHIRPEALALLQRQLDQLAAGDVADAQDHGLIIAAVLRQTQHQP